MNLPTSYIGCGYPPLSVRAVTRKIADLLHVPVLGLFDYNVSCSLCVDGFHISDTFAKIQS